MEKKETKDGIVYTYEKKQEEGYFFESELYKKKIMKGTMIDMFSFAYKAGAIAMMNEMMAEGKFSGEKFLNELVGFNLIDK